MTTDIENKLRQLGTSLRSQTEFAADQRLVAHRVAAREQALQAFRAQQRSSRIEQRSIFSRSLRAPLFQGALVCGLLLLVLMVERARFGEEPLPQISGTIVEQLETSEQSAAFGDEGEFVEYVSLSVEYEELNFSMEEMSLADLNHNITNEVNDETLL